MPVGKLSVATHCYSCLVFNLVGAFTDRNDILLGGNVTDHEFQIIGSVLED